MVLDAGTAYCILAVPTGVQSGPKRVKVGLYVDIGALDAGLISLPSIMSRKGKWLDYVSQLPRTSMLKSKRKAAGRWVVLVLPLQWKFLSFVSNKKKREEQKKILQQKAFSC
jgi:hypothetical protein